MACDVASSSNSPSLFGEGWDCRNPETTDLSSLPEFNDLFSTHSDHGIDPFPFSNPASPASPFAGFDSGAVDATLSPEASNTGLGLYTDDPGTNCSPSSPYFDITPAAPFNPAAARYQTRQRSVSEPPADFSMHHHQVPQPAQMTFNRNGHYLGEPAQHPRPHHQPKMLKSLPKHKRALLRGTTGPYSRAKNTRHMIPDQQQAQQRHQLRRAQTQPVRPPTSGPTSAPMNIAPSQHPQQASMHGMHGGPVFEPLPPVIEGQRYITSRICTPTPEPSPRRQDVMGFEQQQQGINLDPQLMGASSNVGARGSAITVPLTVDELRRIITEAVEKAVKGLESKNVDTVESVEEERRETYAKEDSEGTAAAADGDEIDQAVDGSASGPDQIMK